MPTRFRQDPLIARAREAARRAHAPYSRYRVGAAFELARAAGEGDTFRYCPGANIENVSYGLTICAERVALGVLIASGESTRNVTRLAVSAKGKKHPIPCGACLQVLSEFFDDLEIVLDRGVGAPRVTVLRKLMPVAFRFRRAGNRRP